MRLEIILKLEELYEQIEEDFPIKKTDLADESLKTAKLFIKFIKLWSTEKLYLKKYYNVRKTLENEKHAYYSGNASAEVYQAKPFGQKLRTESLIQKYIDADPDVVKVDEQILVQETKVEVLTACLDEIKRRGYAIKTALDDIKFKAGS